MDVLDVAPATLLTLLVLASPSSVPSELAIMAT